MNTENNKIIAEFMGEKIFNSPLLVFDIPQHAMENEKTENGASLFEPNKLRYHSDWNWLMEVVEKIDYLERNTDNEVFIKKISSVTSLPLFTPKHTVYNACVEFIKWYNNQNSAK